MAEKIESKTGKMSDYIGGVRARVEGAGSSKDLL